MPLVIPANATRVYLIADGWAALSALGMPEIRRILTSHGPASFRPDGQDCALQFLNDDTFEAVGETPITRSAYKQLRQQLKTRVTHRQGPVLRAAPVQLCHGLVVTTSHMWGPGRFRVWGRGVVGVYAEHGRWPEDPSPCLYLAKAGHFDRMATAHATPVPKTGAEWRRLLRQVRTQESGFRPTGSWPISPVTFW